MDAASVLIGIGIGALAAAGAAYAASRRYVARVRAAERRAQAAERMAEIGSMTGGLAHEIKNPLSTIALNAGLLSEAIEDLDIAQDERSRLLSRMTSLRRETDRLSDILKDFLGYAGRVHLERRDTDVNELVNELVDFYTPEAERQGVRIRRESAAGELRASIDSKLVKQAVLNLMINATQAMASMGAQTDGWPERTRELILRTTRARDEEGRSVVRVEVVDTGPGMSTDTIERIFNPYFTTKPGGSGLGLPMSRRFIDEHGGQIRVVSEVGKGSCFVVSLPIEG